MKSPPNPAQKSETLLPDRADRLDPQARHVSDHYEYAVTKTVQNTAGKNENDPVVRQYRPDPRELITLPEETADPIGDHPYSPVTGIVHRHANRALFMPIKICAVYCRFCFRREQVGSGNTRLTAQELEEALLYLSDHQEIEEVILTGGDPFVCGPRYLKTLFSALDDMPHIQSIRVHTRVPVVDPERLTEDFVQALCCSKPVNIVLHINHAQEITKEAETALARLHQTGCGLYSQSVLLRGVNDHEDSLSDLFRQLVRLRVKPLYLHHPDLAPGTSHFRLPFERGMMLMRILQGKLSSLQMPRYVIDIPGGYCKVPVTPEYITRRKTHYDITAPDGQVFTYPLHDQGVKHD